IERVVLVERETLVRHARENRTPYEVAAVLTGGDRVGHFEQPSFDAPGSPGLFRRQVATPWRPARRVAGNEPLRAGLDDGDGARVVMRILRVDTLDSGG